MSEYRYIYYEDITIDDLPSLQIPHMRVFFTEEFTDEELEAIADRIFLHLCNFEFGDARDDDEEVALPGDYFGNLEDTMGLVVEDMASNFIDYSILAPLYVLLVEGVRINKRILEWIIYTFTLSEKNSRINHTEKLFDKSYFENLEKVFGNTKHYEELKRRTSLITWQLSYNLYLDTQVSEQGMKWLMFLPYVNDVFNGSSRKGILTAKQEALPGRSKICL